MTTTTAGTMPWNIVTKNIIEDDLLRKKIREKIGKLERHLVHFPPDAVHLHVALERHSKKELYFARLNLRVPSHILHTEQSAPDLVQAFDDAVKALLRELETLKSRLRGEPFWKHKDRRQQLRELKATGFAAEPEASGAGPQNFEHVVRDLFQQRYESLLERTRRLIQYGEAEGEFPAGALDARDIVDEAALHAMSRAGEKPTETNWLDWFQQLIYQEVHRQRRELALARAQNISLEQRKISPDAPEISAGYDAENPLDIIIENLEPPVLQARDLILDPGAAPPDEIAEQKDLLHRLEVAAQDWPPEGRKVFELYVGEGFEPAEIAMVIDQPVETVQEYVARIQSLVHEELHEPEPQR
jgi:ribosomal subunit interface protein